MFRSQSMQGPCGAFAIHGALRMLGQDATVRQVAKAAHMSLINMYMDGIDEEQMVKAIQNLGFKPKTYDCKKRIDMWNQLRSALKRGNPCIIAPQDAEHWATVIGFHERQLIWYDSFDDDLLGVWSEKRMNRWMEQNYEHYFIEVINNGFTLVNKIPIDYFIDAVMRQQLLTKPTQILSQLADNNK